MSVGVTVATTLIVFFVTGASPDDLKVLITICIGLVGTVICLQLETLLMVAERHKSREMHGRLLEFLEEFPELLPPMARIAEAATKTLRDSEVEQFRSRVSGVLTDSYVSLQELAEGRLRITGVDGRLHRRFEAAHLSLQGTTDIGDTLWWRQDAGREFFEINQRLVERGVTIERIWLVDRPPDAATLEVMAMHDAAKINVYVVRSGEVDPIHLVNMTLMDEQFLHEDVVNKHGYAIEYIYSTNEADLLRAAGRFAELKAHAVRYRGPESVGVLFAPPDAPPTADAAVPSAQKPPPYGRGVRFG